MVKKIGKLFIPVFLIATLCYTTLAYANTEGTLDERKQLTDAYESVISYAQENNISLDLSFDTFLEEYGSGRYASADDCAQAYLNVLEAPENQRPKSSSSSAGT